MGPINRTYQPEPAAPAASTEIYHFAHHHPLQLSHNHNQQIPCTACTHPTSTPAYGCQHCNYYLHITCSKMPQQLQHPFDTNKTHALILHPKPVYPEGLFNCDACAHQGSGFSYHCSDCSIDLHVLCAALPAMVSVPGHEHQLTRVFRPPYPNSEFACDVCTMPGSNTWLYHCATCQYDVHLGCIRGNQQHKAQLPARSVSYPPAQQQRYHQQQQNQHGHSYNQGQQPVMGQPYYNNQQHQQQARKPGPQVYNSIANGVMEGVLEAAAQSLATMAIGAIVGGGAAECGGAEAVAVEGAFEV